MSNANEFIGKRVLVTGGSKGIGEAIVSRLRDGGGRVLATGRTAPHGDHKNFIQADGYTRAGADHIIKTALERLDGLDILINNLGGSSAPGESVLDVIRAAANSIAA